MVDWVGRLESMDGQYVVTWAPGIDGGSYVAWADPKGGVYTRICVSKDIKECIQKCERHAALNELVRDAEELGLYDTDKEDVNE